MNIYLDIDGTLITNDWDAKPAEGLHEFLKYMTKNHTCYWLTTHCRDGTLDHLYNYMSPKLPPETFKLIKMILPTVWDMNKTEAIDFTQDFRWFDDSPMAHEMQQLHDNNNVSKLIEINLKSNPSQLRSLDLWS